MAMSSTSPMPRRLLLGALAAVLTFCAANASRAQSSQPTSASAAIVLRDALVIDRVGQAGRNAMHTDAIEAQIVAGTWHAPKAGDAVTLPDGSHREWKSATAGEDGWLRDSALQGGYAFFTLESERDQIVLLHAQGHNCVYVNGEIRAGDPYSLGFVQLPVQLHQGTNELLFHCSRGQLWARLTPPAAPLMFNPGDVTLPNLADGRMWDEFGAIVVINASAESVSDAILESNIEGPEWTATGMPSIPPLGVRKAVFRYGGIAPDGPGSANLDLRLRRKSTPGEIFAQEHLTVAFAAPTQMHKRTFLS